MREILTKILVGVFFIPIGQGYSQNSISATDTAQINTLIRNAQSSQSRNEPDAALNDALFAYTSSVKSNYSEGMANSLQAIFQAYYSKSDYKNALTYELKYLELAEKEKNRSHIAFAYKKIAVIYQEQQHLHKSLGFYYQSYEIFAALKDSQNIAGVLTNRGLNYYQLTKETLGAKRKIYLDSALNDLTTSLKISKKNNLDKITAANLGNLSEIYTSLKNFSLAIQYSLESIENSKKIGDFNGEAISYFDLGNIYFDKNDFKSAIDYFQKALALAKQTHNKYLESYCYSALARTSGMTGDFKNAYAFQVKHSAANDSIMTVEDQKQITEMQTKYETEKKEALNKVLTDQNKLSAQTIKQQKTINYIIIGAFIMALVFSFLIFNGLKKQRNANVIISKQKQEVELKSSEIAKQKELIEEKQKSILDSIHYAKRIQTTILPQQEVIDKHLSQNFVFYKPKDIVSGDFYWATYHKDAFYLAVCDSTGHGVPGAFMSILSIGFLSEAINENDVNEPNEIFNYVRERLINSISKDGQRDGFDGILMRFDKKSKTITYAAANNSPLLIRNNQYTELPKDKMPVGKGEKKDSFTLHSVDIQKGDCLCLFTDGYADQFGGPSSKKFMYKPLYELLVSVNDKSPEEQKNTLHKQFTDWKGSLEQVDDVLIIGIKL